MSTTALHWLEPDVLASVYAALARLLRPGGLVLNCDELAVDTTSPVIARLDRALLAREDKRRFPDGHSETWPGWWQGITAVPALAEAVGERTRRGFGLHHGSPSGQVTTHVEALLAAGFAEVGTLWQRGEVRLLCAVR